MMTPKQFNKLPKYAQDDIKSLTAMIDELEGNDTAEMRPGDIFVIETPGGGGYGPANK